MDAPHKRKPIRTDQEAGNRCTSRWGSHRCRLQSGHSGAHDAGVVDAIEVKWGGRVYRRR